MKGTEQALEVLGKSGMIYEKEELPEDYDIELDFSFSEIIELVEKSSSLQEFEQLIREKQDGVQERFEQAREDIISQLDRISRGDKVRVDSSFTEGEGKVRKTIVDHGTVYYVVYDGREKLGEFHEDNVELLDEVQNAKNGESSG